ncbi:hypothetical protein [Ruminococcus sp. Marseille-P6503]|uniref:hypothetical protein n=1 Tax=Ruminococcus sp. Marseille-P6503 TaxID=2364796 RepID=UPI000F53BAB6|nr:hypothetical protein [Ruminococcus sp. Marseille-P6503]
MILYEYPPKLRRQERQLKAVHDIEEHKKMQRTLYKNLILGAVIIFLGIMIPLAVIKIIVLLLGFLNIATAFLLYRYSAMSRDTKCYTRIYSDRIEHCQGSMLTDRKTVMTVYYDDIVKSFQNPSGKLIICLKNNYRSEITCDRPSRGFKKNMSENKITMDFQDIKAKLYLIQNLSEEIKYPKKQYRTIDDEESEDDKWDLLHKHGL